MDDFAVKLAFGLCVVALLVQLVPFPKPILDWVSPSTVPFESPRWWHPISLAPAATWRALAWLLIVTGVFFSVSRLLSRIGVVPAVGGLLAISAAVGFLGIVQKVGAGRIPGVPPVPECSPQFGPFANENHFAGWMLMALPPGLGLLCGLMEPFNLASISVAGALTVMVTSLFLTQSRGAIGCFSLVAVAFLVLVMRTRTGPGRRLALCAVGLFAAIGVAVVGPATLITRFRVMDLGTVNGRLAPWTTAVHIARTFPLTGAGLNTYGLVAPMFESPNARHLDAAHDDYLQLAADGGLLIALPAAILLVILGREVWRRFHARGDDAITHWVRAGAAIALLAIACQEIVDFSLQVPANAVLFSVVWAIAAHRPHLVL